MKKFLPISASLALAVSAWSQAVLTPSSPVLTSSPAFVADSPVLSVLGLLNVLNGGGSNGLTSPATSVGLLDHLQSGSITNLLVP